MQKWTCSVCNVLCRWPIEGSWRHRSGSTLVQIMACCLTARVRAHTTRVLVLSKIINMNTLKTLYSRTTRVPFYSTRTRMFSTRPQPTWMYQPITWTILDFSGVRSCDIYLQEMALWGPTLLLCMVSLKIIPFSNHCRIPSGPMS